MISLIKPIEATKVNPRTWMPLGVPDVTVPYGALIQHVGSDRDREKIVYLSESYTCKHEAFVTATGGAKRAPEPAEAAADPGPAAAAVAAAAAEPEPAVAAGPKLEWTAVNSSRPVSRARVPGGWLVTLGASGVTFVPDAEHAWDGGSLSEPGTQA